MSVSMFDRYGGFASVSKIVMAFYDRALDSEFIGEYFENSDMKTLRSVFATGAKRWGVTGWRRPLRPQPPAPRRQRGSRAPRRYATG